MIGKGCHPLTAALYLKYVEGRARTGTPIRPKAVSGRMHILTRMEDYIDKGHLRTNYTDIEDFAMLHVRFEDGTLADIFTSEIILGGVHNWLEVAANNHRTLCHINPNTAMQTYNPSEVYFRDIYDHMLRMELISESLRDLASGALDTYLSVVNNRMNDVMKMLTIITTLFMPITFITGFFGMNFFQAGGTLGTWTGKLAFIIILAFLILIPAGMFMWMRKRKWM